MTEYDGPLLYTAVPSGMFGPSHYSAHDWGSQSNIDYNCKIGSEQSSADLVFRKFIRRVGVLRAMLAAVTILLIAMAPFAGGETQLSGWAMMPTLIAPALVPMLFFVFPLDMTMSAVYMSGKSAEHKPRYQFIIAMDIVLLLLLFLAWLPFFRSLLRGA